MLTERQAHFIEAEARDQGVWEVADAVGPFKENMPERGLVKDKYGVDLRFTHGNQFWVTDILTWAKLYVRVEELRAVAEEAASLGCTFGWRLTKAGKDSFYMEVRPPQGHREPSYIGRRVGTRKTWEKLKSEWFEYDLDGTVAEDTRELPR